MLTEPSPLALACRTTAQALNLKKIDMKLLPTFLQKLPKIYEKVLSPTTLTPSSLNTSRRQERSPKQSLKTWGKEHCGFFLPFPLGRGGRCFSESESRQAGSKRIDCGDWKWLQEEDATSRSPPAGEGWVTPGLLGHLLPLLPSPQGRDSPELSPIAPLRMMTSAPKRAARPPPLHHHLWRRAGGHWPGWLVKK